MDSSVSSAHVADAPLPMRALEPYVEDELAPDAQAPPKDLLGDELGHFFPDGARTHTALQEVRPPCHSSLQGGGVVCVLVATGGMKAKHALDGGLPLPRGVLPFLVVTGGCFRVSGDVGLVGGGPV